VIPAEVKPKLNDPDFLNGLKTVSVSELDASTAFPTELTSNLVAIAALFTSQRTPRIHSAHKAIL
jgi:hypothetical protein